MPEILNSTYEILKELGRGGGGVVYLAEHQRLKKLVVVKQDRRRVSASRKTVEREMNVLKNLNHKYIPHLYDFFTDENANTAYTVMDYIEGESLNKPLRRGEKFPQARVIDWGCQLLEALDYLHTRKPHGYVHGDVKPSNLMLTPDGDIRLIDFNISLALDGNSAVIGYTEGYASPEHYHNEELTVIPENDMLSIERSISGESLSGSGSSGPYEQVLDARSDIYGVGATLYRLLSGRRPAKHAEDVTPLTKDEASGLVREIIQKAMAPNPDDRYQTAAEMLDALESLPIRDPGAKRHHRIGVIAAVISLILFLSGGVLTFIGLKQTETLQKTYGMARDSVEALQDGDRDAAIVGALSALSENPGLFDPPYTTQAHRALSDALGVYDITNGYKAHKRVSLPSAPMKTGLSPDGRYMIALTDRDFRIFETETGELIADPLAAEYSALSDFAFTAHDTILYAGNGSFSEFDLNQKEIVWTSGKPVTAVALSADGSTAAVNYKDNNNAVIYNLYTRQTECVVSFENRRPNVPPGSLLYDAGQRIFALDVSGQWLAVSFQDGGLKLFNLFDPQQVIVLLDVSQYDKFEGGFSGPFFVWSGAGDQGAIFSILNLETMETVGSVESGAAFHVQADQSGVYVSNLQNDEYGFHAYAENILTRLDPYSWTGTIAAQINGTIDNFIISNPTGDILIVTSDRRYLAFDASGELVTEYTSDAAMDFADIKGDYILTANRDEPYLNLYKRVRNSDAVLFRYEPGWTHTEARVLSDLSSAILFRYDALRVISRGGEILADIEIPDAMETYSQYYYKDRDVLEIVYNNGLVRSYSGRNGEALPEEWRDPPAEDHAGTYVTDDYIVETPLHGAGTAYNQEGEILTELERDGYLYDAAQVGEYLVTFYLTTDGEYYGLLLDANGNTIADLPNLCDALPNGTLIFDDQRGALYQGRVYHLDELTAMARERLAQS